ncbi:MULTISPECIES: hypothetical protein [Allobaculum]|uniref:hypothetical protein n=1 Tax=Allobaculum TaxID=174708 RepID=UPI001E470051|nr:MULTISPECIES: hypothetical protein [Allobaculum]UNT92640.1 hypothetical protein KWG61_10975 [Allobaculum sp. Allo2]
MKEKIIRFCENFADRVENDSMTVGELVRYALEIVGVIVIVRWIWQLICLVFIYE